MSEELKAKDLATIEFSIDKVCTLYFYRNITIKLHPTNNSRIHRNEPNYPTYKGYKVYKLMILLALLPI